MTKVLHDAQLWPSANTGVTIWPSLLEPELLEKYDSLREGRGDMTECLIYLGSHMGNDLIIEFVFS